MKKILVVTMIVLVAWMAYPVKAADAVDPETVTNCVNARTDVSDVNLSSTYYYLGSQMLLSNCIARTSTGTTQGLDQVTVQIKVGTEATNNTFSGTAYASTPGLTNRWWALITIPSPASAANMHLQVKLTDVNTNSYIYPWKKVLTKEAL